MGVRINTIMQTCFFALSGVLPQEEAIDKIKEAVRKGKRTQALLEHPQERRDAGGFGISIPGYKFRRRLSEGGRTGSIELPGSIRKPQIGSKPALL